MHTLPRVVTANNRRRPWPAWAAALAVFLMFAAQSHATRIKDMVLVEGGRENQLVGYGIVVGLANKGDSQLNFTVQSIANALKRFGVNVPASALKSTNVAAVMVTADIPAFAKPGSRIDVTVSAIGDATTIQGGVLLQTPLLGADDAVYAVAQGPVAIGGFSAGNGGAGGASVQKNHPTVGIISSGALVEREIATTIVNNNSVSLLLLNPDYASAARIAEAINNVFPKTAVAKDASTVNASIPAQYAGYEVNFIASLGAIEAVPDNVARVVINERTGTIIATANVRISTVAVSHGSLTINIASTPAVSQPNAFSAGQTVATQTTDVQVNEKQGSFKVVDDLPTIQEVAAALNALGLSTRDMMAIFQTMKRAGALHADLVLN
ncbi:MAG: flagellar basal body P-ring protein FlgI [Chthoniobacteraceae bacterium]|nr:flagellar basal body P-ring protein FlgI [Chthoniobacteraceae bacterium]